HRACNAGDRTPLSPSMSSSHVSSPLMSNRNASSSKSVAHPLALRHAFTAATRRKAKSLPAAPRSLGRLVRLAGQGLTVAAGTPEGLEALQDLRAVLFEAPGYDAEARALWHEALATAAYAGHLAEIRRGAPAVATL